MDHVRSGQSSHLPVGRYFRSDVDGAFGRQAGFLLQLENILLGEGYWLDGVEVLRHSVTEPRNGEVNQDWADSH